MRLSMIIASLLMLVQASVAVAQPASPGVDPRWGLLGELAERDLASFYNGKPSMPATVRWEVPNQVLVFTDWGPVQRSEHRFTLDSLTGLISVEGFSRASPTAEAMASGEIFWILGERREPFLSRSGDGAIHARWRPNKLDYLPISRDAGMQGKLAKLVSAGKVRPSAGTSGFALTATAAQAAQSTLAGTQIIIDPRWGILGEVVERDFAFEMTPERLGTFRWEIPNRSLVLTEWSALGTSTYRFALNASTGFVEASIPGVWGNSTKTLIRRSDGSLLTANGSSGKPFLWRGPSGTFKIQPRRAWTLRPIEATSGGEVARRLTTLLSAGKVRAANPSLNTQMATAPAVSPPQQQQQQAALQTVITHNIDQTAAPPASSVAPAVAAAAAVSGPRYALIIGNSQYGSSLGRLPNPVNDAQSVAAALRAVGFNVDLVVDADQKGMKRAISRFGERLSTARGATGLFYYAGHGIQSRGTNYLIPVSAPIEREADLDLEAVAADTVLAQMEDAGAATSIVILDACRNMPLARSFRSASRGLARMDAPNGSFVAYSTAPGAVAADGDGRNSPFAVALVKQLGQKGTPIEVIFRGVRREVVEATGGRQTPWDSSSLLDPFYFVP